MHHPEKHPRLRHWTRLTAVCLLATLGWSCSEPDKPKYNKPPVMYPDLGPKKVPAFMQGSIYQYTETRGAQPAVVAGFGLVVNADPVPNSKIEPGSQQYPTAVREYMLREMQKRGVGSANKPGWEGYTPQQMLADPRNSIVLVRGLIAPGARAGRSMDIEVSALSGSSTQSLARGYLYETDLSPRGGDVRAPGVAINNIAKGKGQVFVNPALAINATAGSSGQRASLREGVILDGGYVAQDRPLVLQLRTPERRLAKQIEWRINQAFPEGKTASAKDEGIVEFFVPARFGDDWEHFAGVVTHLYLNWSPDTAPTIAKKLIDEALKPDALLEDISYCWEGLGAAAMPVIAPLTTHPNPDIAFAAARAAAFMGDPSASDALLAIARTPKHKFQINAVRTLGAIGSSLEVNQKIRTLLDSNETLIRLEAYRMLAKNRDSSIFTRVIATGNEKFVLDLVPSSGPPLIYASRTGVPRIAVIGARPTLAMPLMFSALDHRLTMTSDPKGQYVSIFYRGAEFRDPVTILSQPDLAQIIARLGGEGPLDEAKFDFGYGDVVAMVQSMADGRKLVANHDGRLVAANFVLQELQAIPDDIRSAPLLPGQSRPQQEEGRATSSVGN